jgi:hypothetical protein
MCVYAHAHMVFMHGEETKVMCKALIEQSDVMGRGVLWAVDRDGKEFGGGERGMERLEEVGREGKGGGCGRSGGGGGGGGWQLRW